VHLVGFIAGMRILHVEVSNRFSSGHFSIAAKDILSLRLVCTTST